MRKELEKEEEEKVKGVRRSWIGRFELINGSGIMVMEWKKSGRVRDIIKIIIWH